MSLYRLVVLGDGGVGKTALTIQTYDPTIEDSYRKQVVIDDHPCILEVLDTAGQEEYTARLRDQWIRDGEGFVLVYSTTSRSTFERIEKFKEQITRVKDTNIVPLMLVGNKCDLVKDREVSRDEGYAMAKKIKSDFVETSAKTCVNVEKSFYNVVRMIRSVREGPKKKKKKSKCIIQMSANLLTYLQSELISLSNEAKKKHPEIKEAAERLLYTLKSTKDKAPSSPSTPVSIAQDFVAVELSNIKTDEVLKPFLLSCETKNPKLSSISVNCLQKLISHNAISDISIPSILKTLESISNSGMEMQLKILQTLLPLITNYPSIHGPVLANALSLCFRLHDSKNMVVNGIASATLRQLVTHVFDKVAEEESHELGKGDSGDSILNLPPCTKDAYMLFQDLCLFSNKGETGLFLLKITSVSKSFVLELIEEILSSHHVLFKSHPELLTLLKERTCPLVIRSFSDKNEFSLTLRLMRVLQIILVRFHDTLIMEVEIFLTLLGKLLEPDYAPSWQRVVVMEIYRDICNDNSLLRYTYRSYDTQDHTTKLFQEMAISFTRIIVAERPHFLFTVPTADNSASNAESYALSSAAASVKMRCIDQLEKTEPPSLPEGYLLYLAIHAISDLVDGMLVYILPTSKLSQEEMSENDRREYDTAIEMPKACWSTILATLSFLIPASLDDDIFSLVIRTLQNFTVLVGILGLNSQRDAFLSSICKSCLPGSTYQGKGKHGSLIGERNIVCLKAVLGVSKILMSNLDEKAWYLILDSLQTAEDLLSSGKTGRKENNDVENYFVDTLQNIKTFCDITKTMDGRSAEEFVKALCHLAKDACTLALQNHSPSSSSKEALPQSISRNEEKSFALSRLFDFASLNITRLIVSNPVPSITGSSASSPPFQTWDIIIKSLIDISHHPQCPSSLKSQATFTLSEILNAAMQYGDVSDEVVEMKILAPLKSLMVIESDESLLVIEKIPRMIEIEKSGLEILNRLLQTAGQNIKYGWGLILEIVRTAPNLEKNSSTPSGRSILVRIAFPSLQLICTDFLALLTPAILYDCIETLGRFGAQMDDVNISLTSIGLLWSVSDFLLTQKHAQPELVQEIVSTASLHHAKPFVRSKSMVNLLSDDKAEHRHDVLWMFLLSHFSQLCADSRPEVRNSANQTLFRTIGLNGKKLTLKAWEECFLNILFPLLERVKISSLSVDELAASPANNAKQQQQTLMVHHSRDTTSKQWDETKVLSINGVTNAFIDFLPNLLKLANFETYNAKFLDYIKDWYLSGSPEVSIASIKSLKQMIGISKDGFGEGLLDPLYLSIWSTWEAIGLGLLPANHDSEKLSAIYGPLTQDSLLSYVSVFCELFKEIKSSFELSQLERMCTVLFVVSLYHTVHSSTDRYQNKTNDLDITTPLQSLIIYILVPPAPDSCRDDPLDTPLERLTVSFSHIEGSAVVLIDTISKFTMFPFIERGNESNGSVFTYIALARKSMEILVTLFKSNSNLMGLYSSGTFSRVIQNLGTAMKIKYDCPNVGTKNPTPLWKSACDSFISIIKMGLEAIKNGIDDLDTKEVDNIYANILNILEGFLLPKVEPIGASAEDEAFDISVLHVLKTELLLYFGLPYVKDNMLAKFIQIFVSGSHLYIVRSNEILPSDSSKAINTRSAHKGGQLMVYGGADGLKVKVPPNYNLGSDVEIIGREDFARSCIDFLFEICSTKMTDEPIMRHRIASIAAPMLLQKCTDILTNYVRDRPLFGKMPLPRIRNEEIMFILRHLELLDARKCILIDESDKSDVLRWTILSGSCSFLFTLYPLLCTLLCTISLTEIPSGSEDSDESNVVVSMKCVLNRIGKELGLNK